MVEAIAPFLGPDPSVRGGSREGGVLGEIKGLPGIPRCPGAPPGAGAAVALLLLAPVGVSSAPCAAATYFVQHIFLSGAAGLARCPSRAPADPLPGGRWARGGKTGGGGAAGQMCSDKFQLLAGRGSAHTCASVFFLLSV